MFDLVYRKDGNYYPKGFLENIFHNFFWRNIINFVFLGLWKFLLKCKKFFKLGARKFSFLNYKKLFGVFFFPVFWARKVTSWNIKSFLGFLFLKYEKVPFRCFRFLKYKESFFLRKYKIFLNIRARKSHFPKIQEGFFMVVFFLFFRGWA